MKKKHWNIGLAVLAVFCAIYAQKPSGPQPVNFPYTDPEARYLFDNGSYVTNDAVHLAFTTLLLPSDAPILLDYRVKGSTNDADFATAFNLPLGSLTLPLDYPFPAATNYDWYCYSTWTPGAQSVTNDIYILNWRAANDDALVPIRTAIYDNGEKLAPDLSPQGDTP